MARPGRAPWALLAFAILIAPWSPARAQSFTDALVSAYQTNPAFQADHARQRALDEDVARAAGGWKPQAALNGTYGDGRDQIYSQSSSEINPFTGQVIPIPGHLHQHIIPETYSLQIVQPIYDGGRASADVDRSKATVVAGKSHAVSVEQSTLGDAIQTYYDLYRDQALVGLAKQDVKWLQDEKKATDQLFAKQQVTRTDVAQSDSRLAQGIARQVAAQGAVGSSESAFARATGLYPSPNLPAPPPLPKALLPSSLQEAMSLASQNPTVREAEHAIKAAEADVDFTASALKPTLSLQASSNYQSETSEKNFAQRYNEVIAAVSIPIYTGGTDYARVREAKNILNQRKFEADDARRLAVDRAKRAWEDLTSTRARIEFLKQQVKSAEIARQSIITERSVGTRTTLDQLISEQDWVDADTALIQAQHDEAIATYSLLSAVGRLTARTLHLPVALYDPDENYNKESGRWFGTDIPEQQVPIPQAP
ncbi:MAG TPA: TolC family outer membrane protein [Alphaproteobacteria bacterium]|nr:TolC family outer membrane protein [Alphaproteobacteria bacterium]